MAQLVPCVSCGRHVKAIESTCPFCDEHRGDAEPRALPTERPLSRAAVVLMGGAALAACGKSTAEVKDPPPPIETNMPAPAYGPAPTQVATVVPEAPPDAGPQRMAAPAYGPAPVRKSGDAGKP